MQAIYRNQKSRYKTVQSKWIISVGSFKIAFIEGKVVWLGWFQEYKSYYNIYDANGKYLGTENCLYKANQWVRNNIYDIVQGVRDES